MNKEEFVAEVVDKIHNYIKRFKGVKGYIEKYPKYLYLGYDEYDIAYIYDDIFLEKDGEYYIYGCRVIEVQLDSFMEVG